MVRVPARALIGFDRLDGWAEDDHGAALSAFLTTCDSLTGPGWQALAAEARAVQPGGARAFFERASRPVPVSGPGDALFTGYYEPELEGSRRQTPRFAIPIHALPADLPHGRAWASRAEIEERRLLDGRELEIAWLEDEVDRFFLQVQGSGRIRLAEGGLLRVGYAGTNGHPYRSLGQEMVRRGLIDPRDLTADAVRTWLRVHQGEGRRLMRHNPSYVFFRELTGLPPGDGPLGTLGRPLTAGRSLAVDPDWVPLGAPVWIETTGAAPIRRLMVAQDTGSAIRGPGRGDIFFGTGAAAGHAAGALRDGGTLVVLLPRARRLAREE